MSFRWVAISALGLISVAGMARGATPTDAQIAEIVVKANQVDVDAGRLASE